MQSPGSAEAAAAAERRRQDGISRSTLAEMQMLAGRQNEPPPGIAEDNSALAIGEQGYTHNLPVSVAVAKGMCRSRLAPRAVLKVKPLCVRRCALESNAPPVDGPHLANRKELGVRVGSLFHVCAVCGVAILHMQLWVSGGSRMGNDIAHTAEEVAKKYTVLDNIEDTIAKMRQRLSEGMDDETKLGPPFEAATDKVETAETVIDSGRLVSRCDLCGEEFPNTYIKAHRRVCLESRKAPPQRINRGRQVSLPDVSADPGLLDARLASPVGAGSSFNALLRDGRRANLPSDMGERSSTPRARGTAVRFGPDAPGAALTAGPGTAAAVRALARHDVAAPRSPHVTPRSRLPAEGVSVEGFGTLFPVLSPRSSDEDAGLTPRSDGGDTADRQGTDGDGAQDGPAGELDFFLRPPTARNTKSRRHYERTQRPDTGWTRRSSVASAESAGSAYSIEGIAEFLQLNWDKGTGVALKDNVVEGLNTLFTEHFNPRSLGTELVPMVGPDAVLLSSDAGGLQFSLGVTQRIPTLSPNHARRPRRLGDDTHSSYHRLGAGSEVHTVLDACLSRVIPPRVGWHFAGTDSGACHRCHVAQHHTSVGEAAVHRRVPRERLHRSLQHS